MVDDGGTANVRCEEGMVCAEQKPATRTKRPTTMRSEGIGGSERGTGRAGECRSVLRRRRSDEATKRLRNRTAHVASRTIRIMDHQDNG